MMNNTVEITPQVVKLFLSRSAFDLRASQAAISFPIIQRIHRRLQQGYKFRKIKVLDGVIIDGHHRYICLSMLQMKVESVKAGKNITMLNIVQWAAVFVDQKDYDTLLEIKMYAKKYG